MWSLEKAGVRRHAETARVELYLVIYTTIMSTSRDHCLAGLASEDAGYFEQCLCFVMYDFILRYILSNTSTTSFQSIYVFVQSLAVDSFHVETRLPLTESLA